MVLGQGVDLATTSRRVGISTRILEALGTSRVKRSVAHGAGLCGSVVLYATSQPPYAFAGLAPIALVPWLLVVSRSRAAVGALSGLAFALIGGVLTNAWVPGALEAFGASPSGAALGMVVAVLLGRGLPWVVIGAVAAATGRAPPFRRMAALAATFAATGAAVQSLPLGIPWETPGLSQAAIPGVAQLAALGGVPLISGLLAAVNGGIAVLLAAWRTEARSIALRGAAVAAGAYGAALLLGLPAAQWARAAQVSEEPLDLLLVQPNIPLAERWMRSVQHTNLAIVGRQTQAALAASESAPDLVLWPETVLTNPLDTDEALREDLLAWVRRLGVPVILGAVRSARSGDSRQYRNSVLRADPERGLVAEFDKTRAIPVIESAGLPWSRSLGAAMGLPPMTRTVEEGTVETPLAGSPSFAVAVCFEALYPGLVAARRDAATAAILVLANDSWFVSEGPSRQQLAFVAFRAIEQRLWLLRVAHGGISAVVDPYGRVVAELPFDAKRTLRARIPLELPPGLRERLALALVLVGGGALGWLASAAPSRRTP